MTGGTGAKGAPPEFTEVELAWIGAHMSELRRSILEQRTRQRALWIGFVVGLTAHVGGYLLRSSAATAPVGLWGDLLYTFGWALWTGVVVVVFLQIFPESKQRQIMQALDAYESGLRRGPESDATGRRATTEHLHRVKASIAADTDAAQAQTATERTAAFTTGGVRA